MKVFVYPNPTSADRPVEHGPQLHVPVSPESIEDVSLSSSEFNESQPNDVKLQSYPQNLKP